MRNAALRAAWSRTRSHSWAMKGSVIAGSSSEARNIGARDAARAHVRTAPLGAALERRHRLAGVEDAVRIERALHVMERGELGRAELHAHLAQLLDAHAVLAGDRAAHFHAALEDAPAQLLGALDLSRPVGVVEDARVDVAVACVEHVAHREAVLGGKRVHVVEAIV